MGCLSACWAGITPTLVSQFIPVPQISGLRYRAKVQSLLPAIESSPPREFFLEFVQLDTHFTFSEIIHQCQDYFYVRICVDFSGEFGLLYLYLIHPIFIRNTAFGVQIHVRMSRLRQYTLIRYAFKDLVIGQLSEHGRHLCRSHLLCL